MEIKSHFMSSCQIPVINGLDDTPSRFVLQKAMPYASRISASHMLKERVDQSSESPSKA